MTDIKSRLRADLLLLLVAVLWGSAFVVQRIAAAKLGVFMFTGLRFLLGAVLLFPWLRGRGRYLTQKKAVLAALAGVVLFCGSLFQQWGLKYTTAGNAGFITGLYVVLVPVILAIGWREKFRATVLIACLLSAVGLFLLSVQGRIALNIGDVLELVGAFIWAGHVILVGWLTRQSDALALSVVQALVVGILGLSASAFFEGFRFSGITSVWWTILYTGIFSVAIGYTLQFIGQKTAPPTDAAIIMSSEAVIAALSGWTFLDERLNRLQILGCGLIFMSMILAQVGKKNQ